MRVERAERGEKWEIRAQYGTIELVGGEMEVCESNTCSNFPGRNN